MGDVVPVVVVPPPSRFPEPNPNLLMLSYAGRLGEDATSVGVLLHAAEKGTASTTKTMPTRACFMANLPRNQKGLCRLH